MRRDMLRFGDSVDMGCASAGIATAPPGAVLQWQLLHLLGCLHLLGPSYSGSYCTSWGRPTVAATAPPGAVLQWQLLHLLGLSYSYCPSWGRPTATAPPGAVLQWQLLHLLGCPTATAPPGDVLQLLHLLGMSYSYCTSWAVLQLLHLLGLSYMWQLLYLWGGNELQKARGWRRDCTTLLYVKMSL
ncbi:hypothetical protein ACOMHN_063023 [Nucella lapillus]